MTHTGKTMVERVAMAIASGLGDTFDLSFLSKSSWTHARGICVDGTMRDVNAPLQYDYLYAARAAIEAMREPTAFMSSQVTDDDAKAIYRDFIDAALSEGKEG